MLLRDGVLIAGDTILTGITPAIGLYPRSRPDPLGDYFGTLARIEDLDPRVAYSGHKDAIAAPALRAREIARSPSRPARSRRGHAGHGAEERLRRLAGALPRRPPPTAQALRDRRVSGASGAARPRRTRREGRCCLRQGATGCGPQLDSSDLTLMSKKDDKPISGRENDAVTIDHSAPGIDQGRSKSNRFGITAGAFLVVAAAPHDRPSSRQLVAATDGCGAYELTLL